jgi:hypothetical protein
MQTDSACVIRPLVGSERATAARKLDMVLPPVEILEIIVTIELRASRVSRQGACYQ